MKKVLILSANPINTTQLRLNTEVREIQLALERKRNRDEFELIPRLAVRIDDLRRALLDYSSQIVHFSGHGDGVNGIALEDNNGHTQLVSTDSLSNFFKLSQETVECVLLNACYSKTQADAIYQHINCVIGMERAITDEAARHSYWVESVSFRPDGKLLASASWDNTVKLWDVSTRKEIPTKMRHSIWVTSVSFSPDGRLLASASWDNTVKLWDVSTGKEISTLSGHNRVVYSVSFSPDGRLLASGSSDGTIKLWDVSEHQEIATITSQAGGVKNVSFSPDGRLLASTSDNTITLWDVATRKEINTLTGHKVQITSVGFSPDGKTLASASKDHSIILWDVTTGKKINIFNAKAEVNSISFSRNGRWLASGSVSGVTLWNLEALSNFTLENLLARGCDWVHNYLQTNPNVNNSDKQLCNGIGKTK